MSGMGELPLGQWVGLDSVLPLLRERMIVNGSHFILRRWDCKYIDARIDMRTGHVLLSPGNGPHVPREPVRRTEAALDELAAQAQELGLGYEPGVQSVRRSGAPITSEAEAIALVAACREFLKEAETPAACLARNRRDVQTALQALAKEKALTEQLRMLLRIYGGHAGACERRPCTCGFQAVWEEHCEDKASGDAHG